MPHFVGPVGWAATHAPAVNTQASATKAAEAERRHVCTGFKARLVGGTTAPAAVVATVHLRDGATGAGTPLMTFTLALAAAVAAVDEVSMEGIAVFGSANTALTIEFVAAGGLNTFEAVTMTGYTVQVFPGSGY